MEKDADDDTATEDKGIRKEIEEVMVLSIEKLCC
jgi:hypothetical protein